MEYSKPSVIWYPTSGILTQPAKVSKKTYNFHGVIQNQICNLHMFARHTVVLPL
jgi:hypothetical protein